MAKREAQKFAEPLLDQFDLFHFHFAKTLTPDFSDLPVLKQKGKKMVAHFWGSEARIASIAARLNPYVKVKVQNEKFIINRLETIAKYINHAIVGDHEMAEYVKDYFRFVHIIPQVIDLDKYKPPEQPVINEKFKIVHAPTNAESKGTKYILAAIENLSEKYDFDFELIQGLPHEEAKKKYAAADLVIDAIHCGCYGLLAIECMALGKPVICWISDFMKDKYPEGLPIISANPDTIEEQIEWALTNREALPELGERGRSYCEKHLDMNKVVHQFVELYSVL